MHSICATRKRKKKVEKKKRNAIIAPFQALDPNNFVGINYHCKVELVGNSLKGVPEYYAAQ